MFKIFRTHLVLLLALGCAGPVLAQAAGATPHQVYEAIQTGHLDEARQMMNQVLRDHPQSAEAHYVAAELYAREGDLPSARQQLSTAQTLRPGLPFAKPEAVQKLQRELGEGRATRTTPGFAPAAGYSQTRSSIPWGLILIVVGAVAVLWMVVRRRASTAVYNQYPGGVPAGAGGYGPAGGGGYGPGYGPGYGGGGGLGSGIAGGLASGLAVGAGVVAGEELAHHFLDGDRREGNVLPSNNDPGNADMGGQDFGLSDASSWDDGGSGGGDIGGGGGDDWT